MKVLTLDISSRNTGYCIAEYKLENKEIKMVINDSGNIIPVKKHNIYAKMHYLQTSVENILVSNKDISAIVIEKQYTSFNPKTSLILARMAGAVLPLAYKYNLIVTEYSATTIKKATTGSGRAKKEDMIKSVKEIFGLKKDIDDNEADAIGIAYTYLKEDYKGDLCNEN